MNAKSEQKERSHETILASATRLLRERGVSGARVLDVMRGAGLTAGGFYAHFGSKEALIEQTLRRAFRELRVHLFDKLDEKPEADRAEVVLKRYLSAKHRDTQSLGCPLPAVVGEIAVGEPAYRGVLRDEVERFAEDLTVHAPSGDGAHERTVALGMIVLMYGGLTLARAVGPGELSDEVLRACRAFGRAAITSLKRTK
ncbi:MAG: tetR [Myxococcaceae bacterium]|nr:tetR [Myxococcaceae bacterium]